jgi:RNA recognition motif-containing protein
VTLCEEDHLPVRLFVGNLPYDANEAEVREFFAQAGTVTFVHLPVDRETGRPRGFAFVEFAERAQAESAISRFNNQPFKDRPLVVNEARARGEAGPSPRPPSSSPRPSSGPPRGFSPRPSTSWGGDTDEVEMKPGRAAARNFGPDALPKHKRKIDKPEKGPKGPIKERGGSRFFGGLDEDEDSGNEPIDDFAVGLDNAEQDEE